MSKCDFTCVAWFSDLTKALEYTTVTGCKWAVDSIKSWKMHTPGCHINEGDVRLYGADFNRSLFDADTVIEKVNSSTVGDGWAVWVRKPKPEWTEWAKYIHNHAPDRREYRVVDNGDVEYRERVMKNV